MWCIVANHSPDHVNRKRMKTYLQSKKLKVVQFTVAANNTVEHQIIHYITFSRLSWGRTNYI